MSHIFNVTVQTLANYPLRLSEMTFFQKDPKELTAWQLPWTLIWPNDSWLRLVYEKGLVPVLGGIDILVLSDGDASHKDFCDGEGYRLVLGFMPKSPDSPKTIEDALGANFFEGFKDSLHPTYQFNPKASEITIEDKCVRLNIGIHQGKLWPLLLDEPDAFTGMSVSAAIYYHDEAQRVYKIKQPPHGLFSLGGTGSFVII